MLDRMCTRTRWMVLVALAAGLASCASDSTSPDDPADPPPLPPLASMAVDFSLFSGGGAGLAGAANASSVGGVAGAHFSQAALRVFVAEIVAVVVLAVPVATFGAALQAQPTFNAGAWHWQTSANTPRGTWAAHLSGTVQGSDALWEMRITSPPSVSPALEDFLWFSGTSRRDGSSGDWRIFDGGAASGTEVLRLDWTNVSPQDHTLTINVTGAGGPDQGDYVTYDVEGSTRTVIFHDASEGNTVEIGWNATTGEGFIIAPGYNGGVKSCWDSAQNDVACAA